MTRPERLLRWYPQAWRDRYGDEFIALNEDMLTDGPPPRFPFGLRVAVAGLRERANASGLAGTIAPASTRIRSGTLVVLWAWAAFVVLGSALAKRAEHLEARPLTVIASLAIVGLIALLIAALAVVPAASGLLHQHAASGVTPHIRRALVATVSAAVATIGLSRWAASLPAGARENATGSYAIAFALWAVVIVIGLAMWTGAAFAMAQRLDLPRRVLALEMWAATLIAVVMVAITVTAMLWWTTASGPVPSGLIWIIGAMVAADIAAGFGVSCARSRA